MNTKHNVCNFIFVIHCIECNKHKVMSHILKLANMDVTYSLQLL